MPIFNHEEPERRVKKGEFPEQALNLELGNLVDRIEYISKLMRGLCSYHLQLRAFLFN